MKDLELQASITIGINLWLAPQISEHCPNRSPGVLIKNDDWFKRPGIASAFTASEGTVQEWITSAAEIKTRVEILIGIGVRESTSKRRKEFPFSYGNI
jgi:hypothetical protein